MDGWMTGRDRCVALVSLLQEGGGVSSVWRDGGGGRAAADLVLWQDLVEHCEQHGLNVGPPLLAVEHVEGAGLEQRGRQHEVEVQPITGVEPGRRGHLAVARPERLALLVHRARGVLLIHGSHWQAGRQAGTWVGK